MILYANGCSHTAAAEAVHPAAFAEDDWPYRALGRRPHPHNLAVSWCTLLADQIGSQLICHAESASSNDRIIRTTQAWLDQYQGPVNDLLVILQWTTWEREEWLHDGTWYQVNASGIDQVPPELEDRYRRYIVDVDWRQKTQQAHDQIWRMHQVLAQRSIPHVFFNGHSTFSDIADRREWAHSYVAPYDREGSYNAVLLTRGFCYVNPKSYHFGKDAHCFWAQYLLQYLQLHNLIGD
jgi:hypothetical protein